MEITDVVIDIDDLRYDEKSGNWIVDSVDVDKDEVADINEMAELIDKVVEEHVKQAKDVAAHDQHVAVDNAVMHFIQGMLDAAAGLRPTSERVRRVLQQIESAAR